MSLGGRNITDEDIRQYIAMQSAVPAGPAPAPMPYSDPTFLAQQAILARPMRPSFTGQQLMSREVPVGLQGNSGLAYPSMQQSGLLKVPSYTSRYAGTDSSGGGGGGGGGNTTTGGGLDTYASNNSLSNGLVGAMLGLSSQPAYGITVENMGTYANQPSFGMGSAATGIGNPGEAAAADAAAAANAQSMSDMAAAQNADTAAANAAADAAANAQSMSDMAAAQAADTAAANAAGSESSSSKIVCTAMNHEYGFGSFRNAIWLKYAQSNLTKAHEVGYHTIFLPLVDFGFKRGDGRINLMVRNVLESFARHRSMDIRAEMRGTKRDPIGRAYRFILEPLCYAVGKFKGY